MSYFRETTDLQALQSKFHVKHIESNQDVSSKLKQYESLLSDAPPGLLGPKERDQAHAHIEDSLAGLQFVLECAPESLIDVGSGAGLPGIPLAICLPDCSTVLVEAEQRKARFLESCRDELGLTARILVCAERVESLGSGTTRESFSVATCRALAAPIVAAEYLAPMVQVGGTVFIWTSNQLAATASWAGGKALGLADPVIHPAPSVLRGDGVVVALAKLCATNERFPRRIGVAKKRPLE